MISATHIDGWLIFEMTTSEHFREINKYVLFKAVETLKHPSSALMMSLGT